MPTVNSTTVKFTYQYQYARTSSPTITSRFGNHDRIFKDFYEQFDSSFK